jgi:predicted kinase
MRILTIFRGSPACGKSTFIKENNLEQYTLSADNIRLMCQSPVMTVEGGYGISPKNDKKVWELLFDMLEQRMIRGEFIVVDATNSKTTEMTRYKKIAETYRYRIICIDMTDLSIEECKRRNALREPIYKRVPEYVINNQYSRFETQQIPSGIKVIKSSEFKETIKFQPIDLSNYKKIHHIGDIHGCYTALNTYFKDWLKADEIYIFTGDFCDRGIENAQVLQFLFNIMNMPNVILLTGNHEVHLWQYANDMPSKSKEFEKYTKLELNKEQVNKKNIRILYRKLRQIAYYTYNGKEVIVSHGGISDIPDNLEYLAIEQLICGVGQYEDMKVVNDSFVRNTNSNCYQIHYHLMLLFLNVHQIQLHLLNKNIFHLLEVVMNLYFYDHEFDNSLNQYSLQNNHLLL